jgi:hypothetical protein
MNADAGKSASIRLSSAAQQVARSSASPRAPRLRVKITSGFFADSAKNFGPLLRADRN